MVWPLGFGINDRLGHVLLSFDGFEKLVLHLSKLMSALVVSNLVPEPYLHGGVIILSISVNVVLCHVGLILSILIRTLVHVAVVVGLILVESSLAD